MDTDTDENSNDDDDEDLDVEKKFDEFDDEIENINIECESKIEDFKGKEVNGSYKYNRRMVVSIVNKYCSRSSLSKSILTFKILNVFIPALLTSEDVVGNGIDTVTLTIHNEDWDVDDNWWMSAETTALEIERAYYGQT
ncbi:hypothetical protein Tco_0384899 [Tanacetum coccineum]